MSCESNPNKFVRFACVLGAGINKLAGKRAFYAGVAAASAGVFGAAGIVMALNRKNQPALQEPVQLVNPKSVPKFQAREKVSPVAKLSATDSCAGCRSVPGSKSGPWYTIGGRVYCPDCAPDAANRSGADLVLPDVGPAVAISGVKGAASAGSQQNSQRVDTLGTPKKSIYHSPYIPPDSLPFNRQAPVQSLPAPLRIMLSDDPVNGPVYGVVQGFAVQGTTGSGNFDTGLGIVPSVKPTRDGNFEEEPEKWHLIHISSGLPISGAGPYSHPKIPELLASILAQIDFTRDKDAITTSEIRRIGATVTAFNNTMAETIREGKDPSLANIAKTTATTPIRPTSIKDLALPDKSVAGMVIVDPLGNLARVITDTVEAKGTELLIVDDTHLRTEVKRDQCRFPNENDFVAHRVAMILDKSAYPDERCASCEKVVRLSPHSDTWYRIEYKSFCESCAERYARRVQWKLEDEVGEEF